MSRADTGKAIGGWDPAWDIFEAPAPRPLRPQKLHKNQRDRAVRADKVGPLFFKHPGMHTYVYLHIYSPVFTAIVAPQPLELMK